MSATRTFVSPPYTGSSADAELVQRESHVTISAAYYADREATLDLAAAASATPGDLSSVDIARLGSVICDLDTLVVVRDFDLASDYHSYRALQHELQRQIDAHVAIRAAAHAELMAARDELMAQAYKMDQLRADLAIEQSLRLAALDDASDNRMRAITMSMENRALRIQAGIDQLAITVTGRGAVELAADLAHERRSVAIGAYSPDVEVAEPGCAVIA